MMRTEETRRMGHENILEICCKYLEAKFRVVVDGEKVVLQPDINSLQISEPSTFHRIANLSGIKEIHRYGRDIYYSIYAEGIPREKGQLIVNLNRERIPEFLEECKELYEFN